MEIFSDGYTVILLILAVLVGLRLRSVLGKRTGFERPQRLDPVAQREQSKAAVPGTNDNVVPLPRRNDEGAVPQRSAEDRLKGFANDTSPAMAGLIAIARADSSFDPKQFLQGAKAAYEMIVTAFARGDRKELKPLLSREVFDDFSAAIGQREGKSEINETTFVGINSADVIDADVKNGTAQVTVRFVSELISAFKNRAGEVVDGDPKKIREVIDVWTFAREFASRNPNWRLVSTSGAA